MSEKVYLTSCHDYDISKVGEAIDNLFSLMGGIERYISPGETIFLKLNLLMKKHPEEATTTHPAIVEFVVNKIQKAGGKVIIGDSPGGPYMPAILKSIYTASGMTEVAEKTGCQLNFDTSYKNIKTDGKVAKNLDIISPVINCDKVIAIGKLKTHMFMTATMSVKLCFGYIPGLKKADYHLRMNKASAFADLLVDIYEAKKPVLNIIDAVMGMEGDGPSSGKPIYVGCLFAGVNGHAVDTVGSSLMGMVPLSIPTIKQASERELFSGMIEDVEIIGGNIKDFQKVFIHPKVRQIDQYTNKLPNKMQKRLVGYLQPRPVFNSNKCKGCRDCERACPAQTIKMVNNKAVVDLSKCIRCYCCHELCPHKAIDIKKSFISKILSR